jgi:hypothetical protein
MKEIATVAGRRVAIIRRAFSDVPLDYRLLSRLPPQRLWRSGCDERTTPMTSLYYDTRPTPPSNASAFARQKSVRKAKATGVELFSNEYAYGLN